MAGRRRGLKRDAAGDARGPQLISVPRKEGGERGGEDRGGEKRETVAGKGWKGFRFTQVY